LWAIVEENRNIVDDRILMSRLTTQARANLGEPHCVPRADQAFQQAGIDSHRLALHLQAHFVAIVPPGDWLKTLPESVIARSPL
jgi:hypothetical protein